MPDVEKLKAPARHGEVLVAPQPQACSAAARENGERLREAGPVLAQAPLSHWRRRTREQVTGRDDGFIIAIGHQPEFFHPGVWAKHIAAARVAAALEGVAVNLVVDNDAVHRTVLRVPSTTGGGLRVENVRFLPTGTGFAYEQIAAPDEVRLRAFRDGVARAMGDRFDASLMPDFFEGLLAAGGGGSWVEQMLAGRRAIDRRFSVSVCDRRVSELGFDPFLADLLLNADRFAGSYNRALDHYRRRFQIRGAQQPVPDLSCGRDRCEAPLWVYRGDGPRRRVFVGRDGGSLSLFAGEERIGRLPVSGLEGGEVRELFAALDPWQLRPRALTLTIWARLFLADLFIHGIGGAKYDRISDSIISDYYGLEPPAYACVTATLLLDLPASDATEDTVAALRRELRDVRCNPQRHVAPDADVEGLLAQRAHAVSQSRALRESDPGNRAARREAFESIRHANAGLLAARPEAVAECRTRLENALEELQRNRIALDREYFFGLYPRRRLQQLLDALPASGDFLI